MCIRDSFEGDPIPADANGHAALEHIDELLAVVGLGLAGISMGGHMHHGDLHVKGCAPGQEFLNGRAGLIGVLLSLIHI